MSRPGMLTILVALAVMQPGLAQMRGRKSTPPPAPTAPVAAAQPAPEDPLGRGTPYGTVTGFLSAAGREDFTRASKYLDSQQSTRRMQELARQLKLVMDRGLKVDVDKLARTPEGGPGNMLEANRQSVGMAKSGSESMDIVLERVQRGKNQPVWLFSSRTLLSIPDFAASLQAPWIETHVPQWLVERRPLGIQLYRWISVPLSILGSLAVACILVWALSLGFGWFRRRYTKGFSGVKLPTLIGPLRLLISTLLLQILSQIAPTLVARTFWSRIATILTVVGFCWLLMRALDHVAEVMTRRMQQTNTTARIAIVHLFRGLSKPLIIVLGLVIILSLQGVNTTTVITSLGVGGIAIAFAAQKTIENLFGTIMLVSDKTIQIGDTCKCGNITGTVETIGLRSTRLRTLDRTVVTIPNGQLASMSLENLAARDKFLFNHTVALRYETTPDQLLFVIAEVHRLLCEHPNVESQSARIRFIRFGVSSLDLEIFAYIFADEYAAFLATQENLLLRIMDLIVTSGTGVAFLPRITYLGKDLGLNVQKTEASAQKVGVER